MPSPLHEERLQTILSHLRREGVRSVQDLGCGAGELLMRLREESRFEELVGIDIDERALLAARRVLGLDPLDRNGRIRVQRASFEEADRRLQGFDAAVMLETIEHIEPGRLSRVERAVFGRARPRLVLVTTPNSEYNPVHGMAPGEKRHPGHYFEWDRARFQRWADGVAERQGYQVSFFDIGPPYPGCGSSTQMARFRVAEASLSQSA